MIKTDIGGGFLTLTGETGITIRVPVADAPQVVAAALDLLGVHGTRYQQGWKAGRAVGYRDGLQAGYNQRDREYVIAHDRARQQALDEALALLAEPCKAA